MVEVTQVAFRQDVVQRLHQTPFLREGLHVPIDGLLIDKRTVELALLDELFDLRHYVAEYHRALQNLAQGPSSRPLASPEKPQEFRWESRGHTAPARACPIAPRRSRDCWGRVLA
jgi:hypothetical protein